MKWFLAAFVALFIAGFVYWQRQGLKVSYVNGLTAYNTLPGREYIFQRDCYLFKLDDRPSSWPYVGDHAVVASLPTEVDPKHLDVAHPTGRIIDVVRTGSRFKLVSVRFFALIQQVTTNIDTNLDIFNDFNLCLMVFALELSFFF